MNDERMQITCCYWPMNENARSLKLKLITATAFLLVINDSFPQSIHKKQYRTHVKSNTEPIVLVPLVDYELHKY